MKIEILGDGCPRCKALKRKVEEAVGELGIGAEVSTVMDPGRLSELHALSLPQLVIDGRTVPSGNQMTIDGIKAILSTVREQR